MHLDRSRLGSKLDRHRPTTIVDGAGVERLVNRRWGVFVGPDFYCPNGHKLRDTRLILEHGIFRCTYKERRFAAACDVLVYAVRTESMEHQQQMAWALEVLPSELRFMHASGIRTIRDVNLYLGGWK